MHGFLALVARPKGAYQPSMNKHLVCLTSSQSDLSSPAPPAKLANLDALYFVRVGKHLKIGRSRNLKARLRHINCHAPTPPVLVGTLPGKGWTEKVWHTAFCNDRSNREWFNITSELRRAVDTAIRGDDWIAEIASESWRALVRSELTRATIQPPGGHHD